MATHNLKERVTQLDELEAYIADARSRITSVLNFLDWDIDKIQEDSREMVACPLNSEHRVPRDTLEKHIASCSWRKEGYVNDDIPLPESCGPGEAKIVIDKELRTSLIQEAVAMDPSLKTGVPAVGLDDRPIPKTMDRIVTDFTPDERRILYDFAVSKTKAAPTVKVEELQMPLQKEEKQRPKTFIERLAEERDAKRRKVSKKVHTNRKSHVEIMREVIQNQMELYEDFLKQENEELNDNENKKDSDHEREEQKNSPPSRRDSFKKSTHFYEDGEGWKRSGDLPSPRRRNEAHQSHRTGEKWVRKPAYDRKGSEGSYHGDTDRSHRKYSYRESEEKDYHKEYEDRHHKKYKNSIDYASQQRRSYHDRSSSYDSQSRKEYSTKSSSRDDHTGHRHRKNYDSSDSEKNRHQGYSYKEDTKQKYANSDRDSARKSSTHDWEYSRRHRSEYTEDMSDDRDGRDKYRHNHKRNKQLKRRYGSGSSSDGNTSSDSEKKKNKKSRVAESAVSHYKDKHYQEEMPGYEPGVYRSQYKEKSKASSSRDKEDDDSERSYVLKRSRNSECLPEGYSSRGYGEVRGIDDSRTEEGKTSPKYKHGFDWRNSVSSHDSETRHVKHKKKKKKKKRKHKKKEKRSPPDVHESNHSSDDYSC